MRTYERTKDVLDLVKEFHCRVADLYEQLAGTAEQQRAKLLLEFLSRHERHLAKCLDDYEADVSKHVLDTWFQYSPGDIPFDMLRQVKPNPDMTLNEVVDLGMELDDYLIALYRQMAEHADYKQVREVFQGLLAMEQQEEIALLRSALESRDL